MDTIWTIMQWIVYLFEFFGFAFIAIAALVVTINPGNIEWVDSIRSYIFMSDKEGYHD